MVVLNHPGHVQSFDRDRLDLADHEFLKRASLGVAESRVRFSDFKSDSLAIGSVLDKSRIFEFLAITGRFGSPGQSDSIFFAGRSVAN